MSLNLGTSLRLTAVLLAAALTTASATSGNTPPPNGPAQNGAPPAQAMALPMALGLWKSNFGAVKIEEDFSRGGPQAGFLQGVWTYQRDGQDVVGVFAGALRGNLFEFSWQEPAQPLPLRGHGFISFDLTGQTYRGQWWSDSRDRGGEWTGWRVPAPATGAEPDAVGGLGYSGTGYGDVP